MRCALYHPWVYLHSGIERSIVELLARSRHDWTVYTHHYEPAASYPELSAYDVRELGPRVSVRRSLRPLVHAAWTIGRTALPPADALLVSSEGMGDLVLARTRVPAAAYCHTPLKIRHDPAARARLARLERGKTVVAGLVGPTFELVDRRMWRRYRHVFVNSAETAGRIALAGLVPGGPLEVLYPGVDLERFRPPTGKGRREPLLLVAGRIMWQKNVELAIDAVAELRRRGVPARLVVAGAVDVKSVPYLAALRERAAALPVEFVIEPTDEQLVGLYQTCTAVVFPPCNEDFGIVPLEAMACGAPVLAVDAGGPRESVLDGVTGWLLPASSAAFADQMTSVLTAGDELAGMRVAARARASEFGWERFAQRIDEVMEQIAASA